MRLAILSDIHGNPIALEAVLADIQAQGGVDGYWVLGDHAALGYDPVTVLERLHALPDAHFLRGNTDRYLITGEWPGPSLQEATNNADLVKKAIETAASFAWTLGYVTAAGQWDWLSRLPLELRMTLPDGTRLLGVHAAPGTDDGPGIHPGLSEDELYALLKPAEADLIFVGHTHVPLERTVRGIHVINLGSVSNPVVPPLHARYVLLEAGPNGYQVERRSVEYDRQAVIEAVRQAHHPGSEFIIGYMQGSMVSRWAKVDEPGGE